MTSDSLACVVLAAGKGTRMKSDRPKVLHPVAGRPMLAHVLAAAETLGPERRIVVAGPDMPDVAQAAPGWTTVVQAERLGTADAVRAALGALDGFAGTVMVILGDVPLILPETLRRLLDARRAAGSAGEAPAVSVLGMRVAPPNAYGRLVADAAGDLAAIVEAGEADAETLAIELCNSGLMAFDGARLGALIDAIGSDNAKGEFYLTDAIAVARARGWRCTVVEGPAAEVHGVNSRADLAAAEALMQDRLRAAAMAGGATLIDPASVFLSADTELGRDVTIEPNVVFGPGVRVGDGVEIRAFSHIEGTRIGDGARIGPFARLRPGAALGAHVHVGNFVEVKNATLADGAKANHLTYLGDADVGPRANIGAGTITCNYDGFFKYRTAIGAEAFIGSNTALVAPVRVGDRATTAAGSTITRDVADDALGIERSRQESREGWSARFRAAMGARKAAARRNG